MPTISPDATLAICAVVCVLVIGIYALADDAQHRLDRIRWGLYADTVHACEPHDAPNTLDGLPAGVLVGTWAPHDLMAERHWWRCSRCGELEVNLPGGLAVVHAALHECSPSDLARAQAEARAAHPAHRDGLDQ